MSVSSRPTSLADPRTRLRVSVAIQPPAYTRLGTTMAVDPEQLQDRRGDVDVEPYSEQLYRIQYRR